MRGRHRLSGTPGPTQSTGRAICNEPPIETTATVPHRGGPCLHVSRNRHKIGLDRSLNTCYAKTLKKRFLITSPKQASSIKAFVVLDMISYYNKNRGILIEGSGRTSAQEAAINRLALYGATYTGLKLETTTNYGDSDHEPFLNKGMAGALLIESDWSNYKYYHTSKDQMAYQNISYGLEVVKVAAAMLAQKAKIIMK